MNIEKRAASRLKKFLMILTIWGLVVPPALAAEFDYPELVVVPRSSDRVIQEAAAESASPWTRHIPVQVSALSTFVASIFQFGGVNEKRDSGSYSAIAGLGCGVGWLGLTAALSFLHTPYSNAAKEIAASPKGSVREQLARERFAETALASSASLASKLTWFSVISNVGVSAYMLAMAQNKSAAQIVDAASLVLAFTPVVFKYRWTIVHDEQVEFKKRIYGPVSSIDARLGFAPAPLEKAGLTPALLLSFGID